METKWITIKGMFAESPAWKKIILFIFLLLFCASTFSVLATLIVKIAHLPIQSTSALKILQLFGSAGIFIATPLLTIYLTEKSPSDLLKWKMVDPRILGLGLLAMFLFSPFINTISYLNEGMQLPDFMRGIEGWMRDQENKAADLTLQFLETHTIGGLLSNLFIIALIPAIGEELMFRGYIQQQLQKFTNEHVAIWVAAFLFSAIHLQFFGFFPRLLLGALLGYLFFYSKSMIVNIVCHLMNNAVVIIYAFVYGAKEALKSESASMGVFGTKTMVMASVVSLIMTIGVVLLLRKKVTIWQGK